MDVKTVDQFLQTGFFILFARALDEQAKEILHRLRQITGALVKQDRRRVLALRQFRLVGIAQQGKVRQHRRFPTEILIKQQMLGRRRYPFFAAHHMGDAHQMVIDDIGQMVGRQAVRLHQHLHIDDGIFKFDFAAQRILHDAFPFGRDFHADDMADAFGIQLGAVGIGQRQAGAVIFRRLLGGDLVPPHRGQLFRCAIAFERMAVGQQPVAMFGVDRAAFRLAIGSVRTADVRTFIPAQAQPAQRIQDHLFRLQRRACLIGILDAQQKFAAMLFGKAIIYQRNIGCADMGITGGGGRNARTNGHGKSAFNLNCAAL